MAARNRRHLFKLKTMKEFIIQFLNIEERHYPDTLISMKMCEDLMLAWEEKVKKETENHLHNPKL